MATDLVPQVTDFFNAEGLVSTRDQGFAAATFDAALGTTTRAPATGVAEYYAFRPSKGGAVANVYTQVSVVGATLTAGDNLVGLYTSAGGVLTLVATSADNSTVWTSTGLQTVALASTVLEDQQYYFGLLSVGTTPPTFLANPSGATAITACVNGLTTCALGNALAFTAGSSLTALPSSVTVSTGTAIAKKIWIGLA